MGLYLATVADPMRFCGRTGCNPLQSRSHVGLEMSGDPVIGEQNPRREFLRGRSVCVSWGDVFELLTPGQQLKKKRD
jgi:hypothetical protein